jgi:CRP/FNR family transcriptional regulator
MFDISKLSVFSSLNEKDVEEIQDYLVSEQYRKKETIFSEGDPSDWFYIVKKGKVKITKLSVDGKEIILEIIPDMNFFGGLAVLRGFPYPANAVAMEDTEAVKISKNNLMKLLDRFPDIMFSIVQSLGDRMKDSHETAKSIALEKVSARIASLLLKLSEQVGSDTPDGRAIDMRLTKQDIAEMVGTTVETSIRTMSKFKKMGIIEEKAGKIIIKDPSGLESDGL